MRQGQQNKRGRGRGRRTQNPLARNYESNGPDVKIRGTAAHIAEKYVSLARDSQSAGDHITAENYLQHAEHYNRIIAAAQSQFAPMGQQQPSHDGPNGASRRDGPSTDDEQPDVEATPSEGDDAERPSSDGRGASSGEGRGAPSGERRRRGRNGRDREEVSAAEADQGEAVQEPGDDASGAAIS